MKRARPIHLDLLSIRQPLPARISFGHRVSGALLFLGIPVLLQALHMLVTGSTAPMHGVFRVALFIVLAAYAFHFFAGLRFLLLDMHWGVERRSAWRGALMVAMAAVLSVVLLGAWLW